MVTAEPVLPPAARVATTPPIALADTAAPVPLSSVAALSKVQDANTSEGGATEGVAAGLTTCGVAEAVAPVLGVTVVLADSVEADELVLDVEGGADVDGEVPKDCDADAVAVLDADVEGVGVAGTYW